MAKLVVKLDCKDPEDLFNRLKWLLEGEYYNIEIMKETMVMCPDCGHEHNIDLDK